MYVYLVEANIVTYLVIF